MNCFFLNLKVLIFKCRNHVFLKINIARPSRKGTVEAATMVPRERGQQWTAQQLWDVPQLREWLVKEVREHEKLDGLCQPI